MNDLSAPPPPEDEPSQHNRRRRRQESPQILSQEQCLTGLSQLPAMLALDYFKPQKANAMRAVFNDLLRHHTSHRQAAGGALPTADIIALARDNPILLNALEAYLSDEQLDAVMEQIRAGDGPDEEPDGDPAGGAGDGADEGSQVN